jgi:hypothetical protein
MYVFHLFVFEIFIRYHRLTRFSTTCTVFLLIRKNYTSTTDKRTEKSVVLSCQMLLVRILKFSIIIWFGTDPDIF